GDQRHRRRHRRLPPRRLLPLRERSAVELRCQARAAALGSREETAMFRWYVINTYSGHENKVKTNLEHRIESMNQRARFRRVVVPTEQVIETKDGQKVQAEKRTLPGYVLVNMDLNDDAWTVVKNTPGVTGFVGAGATPVPRSASTGSTSWSSARRSTRRQPTRTAASPRSRSPSSRIAPSRSSRRRRRPPS